IYNAVTYPAMVVGLVLQVALHGLPGLWASLAGFAVGFFPAFLLFALGAMGGGDVKLLGAIGALAGVVPTTETLILAFGFGAIFPLGTLAWHGRLFRSRGCILRVMAGWVVPGLPRRSLETPDAPRFHVRFGVAICFGLMATLWDLSSGALSGLL